MVYMSKRATVKKTAKKLAKKTLGRQYDRAVRPKHYGIALAANLKRRFPARTLNVIGVTGTNGKTTTAHMIHQILSQAGYQVGLMTTTGYGINDSIKPQVAHMTTQSIEVTLDRIIAMREAADDDLDWLVLEVTSQALVQFRTLGIPIDIAVMTNITHEHLDYHHTFRKYLEAKLKLFQAAARHKSGRQLGVVNFDDPNSFWFIEAVPNVLTYSLKDQSAAAGSQDAVIAYPHNLDLSPTGGSYDVVVGSDIYKIESNLPGLFNVANCLAAILVARAIGVKKALIEAGIKSLAGVEGRMTTIDEGQDFNVIVDFAHTPDSFEKLFSNLSRDQSGRLITVFGSAGRRDNLKRPTQGEIAGRQSDIVILTEEDDRDEDGQAILEQIAAGATKAGKVLKKDLFLVLDRTKAIKMALEIAQPKDTILLLGKGHEKTIERSEGTFDWDEIGLTRRLLRQHIKKPAAAKKKKSAAPKKSRSA